MANEKLVSKTGQRITNPYFAKYKPNFEDGILRKHNQPTYEKIIKGLSVGNKVLFEQATGTGKSYLALKFLHDHAKGKRVLFVSPANAIQQSFTNLYNENLGEDFCDFNTCLYQGLKSQQNKKYDIIVFDEVHRLGAETWGPNADILMKNNPQASILGTTATLERPDGVDVTQYFDNKKPVSKVTLVEALEKGILPKPDYTLAKVDFEEDSEYIDTCIKDFKEQLKVVKGEERTQILEFLDRLKKAKQTISESEDIPEILAKELNSKGLQNGKFIVFCPSGVDEDETAESIHKMKSIMKQASKWFAEIEGVKKIKKYSVYSKLDAKKNSKIIKAFEEDDSKSLKLLYSINMLNEGLHVSDIDGVIMLRPTTSRIIYLQQLGRALSVGHKSQPKIFDFVANLNYVNALDFKDMVKQVNDSPKTYNRDDNFDNKEMQNWEFRLDIDNLSVLELIDTLKQNIFDFNHRMDFNFEDFCNRLVAYKKRNGHLNIKQAEKDLDGYSLGQKIANIKSGQIKLREEQIKKLKDLGLNLEVQKSEFAFKFEDFYLRCIAYKERHNGNLSIKKSEKDIDGYPLNQKITNIKRGKIKLSDNQRQMLIDLGLNLEVQKSEFAFDFEDFYSRCVAYKEKNEHLNIKNREKDLDGYPLGIKINGIKQGLNNIAKGIQTTEEQRQKLMDLGLNLGDQSRKFDFEDFYNRLVVYKKRKGHLNIKQLEKDLDDYPLGQKITGIKQGLKNSTNGIQTTEEQRQKLMDLGLNLGNQSRKFDFEDFYNRLLAYKDRNGHLNIKQREKDVDEYPLGEKIANFKKGVTKLSEEQRQQLIDLGLNLEVKQSKVDNVSV